MLQRRSIIYGLVLSATVIVLAGCERAASAARHADALVIARFAGDISFTRSGAQQQMRYVVQDEFPAEDVLAFIRTELARRNWKPLRNEFLNPSQPSSHLRGWVESGAVRRWTAQWQDDSHDIVSYTLEYRDDRGVPDLKTLHVTGVYMPAEVAAQARAQAQTSLATR